MNLRPGEFVQVRSRDEILSTLDRRNKNRGLLFDSEMVRYCGGTFRVLKRVYQIVDERTGKMMKMKSPCIILEGVACGASVTAMVLASTPISPRSKSVCVGHFAAKSRCKDGLSCLRYME